MYRVLNTCKNITRFVMTCGWNLTSLLAVRTLGIELQMKGAWNAARLLLFLFRRGSVPWHIALCQHGSGVEYARYCTSSSEQSSQQKQLIEHYWLRCVHFCDYFISHSYRCGLRAIRYTRYAILMSTNAACVIMNYCGSLLWACERWLNVRTNTDYTDTRGSIPSYNTHGK